MIIGEANPPPGSYDTVCYIHIKRFDDGKNSIMKINFITVTGSRQKTKQFKFGTLN